MHYDFFGIQDRTKISSQIYDHIVLHLQVAELPRLFILRGPKFRDFFYLIRADLLKLVSLLYRGLQDVQHFYDACSQRFQAVGAEFIA